MPFEKLGQLGHQLNEALTLSSCLEKGIQNVFKVY